MLSLWCRQTLVTAEILPFHEQAGPCVHHSYCGILPSRRLCSRSLPKTRFTAHLPKTCQAPKTTQFPATHSQQSKYISAKLAGLPYSISYHRTNGINPLAPAFRWLSRGHPALQGIPPLSPLKDNFTRVSLFLTKSNHRLRRKTRISRYIPTPLHPNVRRCTHIQVTDTAAVPPRSSRNTFAISPPA